MLSPTLLLSVISLAFSLHWLYSNYRPSQALLSHIPIVKFNGNDDRQRYLQQNQFRDLVRQGYQEYTKNGRAFKIRSSYGTWRVVIPPDCMEQMKNFPGHTLSWRKTMHDIMMMSHTGAPDRAQWSGRALRVNVTKRLDSLVETMIKKINQEFDGKLTSNTDQWHTVLCIHDLFRRCIAGVVNEVFHGPELASDPEWVEMTMNLTADAWSAAAEIRQYPAWKRMYYAYIRPLDSIRQVRRNKQLARQRLIPIFRDRCDRLLKGQEVPDDALQWLIETGGPAISGYEFADTMSRVMMASIHTTANMLTWALVNLLHRPEYIPDMLLEMRKCFLDGESRLRANDLGSLRRLDSFIMESARFTPLGILMVGRQVTSRTPFTFHTTDGAIQVPSGVSTYAAVEATLQDADIYEDPTKFNGNRSFEARQKSKTADQHWKLANATQDALYFGYGVQACPGRWFGKQEMLLMMSKLVMDYEMVPFLPGLDNKDAVGFGHPPEARYHDTSMQPPNEFGMKVRRKRQPEFPRV